VLSVDVGTSGVRATVVGQDCAIEHEERETILPSSPAPGFIELDPRRLSAAILRVARAALERCGPVAAVGIANQRLTTLLWDRKTSEPAGPGIGWQDVRTAGLCLMLREEGIELAPNQSATKLVVLLDIADPGRTGDFCFGTVDTYVAWVLSGGSLHVTDPTNAYLTGLVDPVPQEGTLGWDAERCARLRIPLSALPDIVPSSGVLGRAAALPGAPPIAGVAGDQQASLIGQGCLIPGAAKATFGTGGMLDCSLGESRPPFERRGTAGSFPIIAWGDEKALHFGVEAVMLSAGSCVEWLRDDLGILPSAEESEALAATVDDSHGVFFVPALFGLGTPVWDFGARGTFVGITRGTTRAHMVRAVLEGVAHRGADLFQAAQADAGLKIGLLKVDGGMSRNGVFLQALADACGRPVEVFPFTEATALGAAFLAGTAVGIWPDLASAAAGVPNGLRIQPRRRPDREAWLRARGRAEKTVEELSALSF
jgi:glycerol kinase